MAGAGFEVLEIVLDGEIPFEVERIAVSTNRARIERIDRLFDVRQQYRRVRIVGF